MSRAAMDSSRKVRSVFPLTFFLMLVLAPSVFGQDRDSWQQPERVLEVIGVKPGMTIGEIGAGRGYFTFRMAERVGKEGHVFANDIDLAALKSIEERCRSENISNITPVAGMEDDPRFPKDRLDMAFMSFVFHMLAKPVDLLKNLKVSLKPGATLVIVEFDPEQDRMWPYPENRRIVELTTEAGYQFDRIETFLGRANIYIFHVEK